MHHPHQDGGTSLIHRLGNIRSSNESLLYHSRMGVIPSSPAFPVPLNLLDFWRLLLSSAASSWDGLSASLPSEPSPAMPVTGSSQCFACSSAFSGKDLHACLLVCTLTSILGSTRLAGVGRVVDIDHHTGISINDMVRNEQRVLYCSRQGSLIVPQFLPK